MINYADPTLFLIEGTTKNLLITDGTVTVSGTTYSVTDETIVFENSDIEAESFSLTQSLCSADQIQFGSCEAAEVTFTVRKNYNSDITGIKVSVYMIPNNDASKMLQLGVFRIYEDKQTQDHLKHTITAYDAMYDILNADVSGWYNSVFPDQNTTLTMAQFRASFLSHFSLTAESTTLINDSVVLHANINIKKDDGSLEPLSGADIIRAICELNGVFGMITNEGKFRFVSLVYTIEHDQSTTDLPVSQCSDIQEQEWSLPIKGLVIKTNHYTETKAWAPFEPYNTYLIIHNPLISDFVASDLTSIVDNLFDKINFHGYTSFSVVTAGNPLHEVGDPIKVYKPDGTFFCTYIFERKLNGIQSLRDTYSANGSRYFNNNLNDSFYRYKGLTNQSESLSPSPGGQSFDFVEAIRNIGFRLLDEPSDASASYDADNQEISLKWKDPLDISTNEPCPATWAGTVVIKKENSAPKNRWDGTLLVDNTTRNNYSVNALVDNNVLANKMYYYGIFPYDTKGDYRFTKCIGVSTGGEDVTIDVFSEGTFSQSVMVDNFSLTNKKQNIPVPLGGATDVSMLSEWFLTEYVLWCGNHFAEPFYVENDYLRKDGLIGDLESNTGDMVSFTGTYFYLPINRINSPKKVCYTGKTIKYNGIQLGRQDYNFVALGAAYVEDGQMTSVFDLEDHVNVADWTDYEMDISAFPYLDYIVLWAADGSPGIKNIKIVY